MLKTLQAHFSYHLHAAISSLNSLLKKPVATAMTVIVIAITLALPTLFWVLSDNLDQLTTNWKRGGHISLYLKKGLSSHEETEFLSRVIETVGVGNASMTSPAQGLAELKKQEGMEYIMAYLPENPLPAVIEVVPALDINTPEKLQQLYNQLKAYSTVEQAKLDMQWINRLHAILGFLAKTAHGLMILLACAVILIVGNTMRLAIHNRHEEIQVLKLIGATDPYIIRPFLYSGIWYGLGGAVLAVLLVNIFILSLSIAVNKLAAVYEMHYSLLGLSIRQISLLITSAILLGWLGARLSVKRQLATIEPYN